MEPLVRRTVEQMGDVYPELRENEAFVLQVATSEEERFAGTLRQGLQLFERAAERAEKAGTLPGDDAFKLSDTFGFPLQLTVELASDAGLTVDVDRFTELLEDQRRRARASAKKVPIGLDGGAVPPSEFVGYQHLEADGRLVAMLDEGDQNPSPKRARTFVCSSTSRRSMRRAAARSATTASSEPRRA